MASATVRRPTCEARGVTSSGELAGVAGFGAPVPKHPLPSRDDGMLHVEDSDVPEIWLGAFCVSESTFGLLMISS